MRSYRVLLALSLITALAGLWVARPAPAVGQAAIPIGQKIANLEFTDADGKTTKLYDLKDKKAIVLVFLSFECPVSTSYSQPLAEMHDSLARHGVSFVGLTVNPDEKPADVAKLAKDYKLPFPVVLDRSYVAADALGAKFTPEVFVLDGDFVLRYRGRIDNTYYARLKKNPQITEHDLQQTLAEMVTGRPVSTQPTVAIGCPIYRDYKTAAKVDHVTYHKDVLPILQKNCQECHRPGEVGPFSLLTYRQAVNWATDIKDYTQSHRMPPWKISDGMEFHNQRRLSEKDLAILAAWADNGTPEGDAKDAPPPMEFSKGWKLGPPDLVLTVSDEFQVGPTGNDLFRCFVLPANLPDDKFVAAIEVRPGNPRIVHHALLFIDTAGAGRKLEKVQGEKPVKDPHGGNELDKGPGYFAGMGVGFTPTSSLGGWAPGQLPRSLPDGTGIKLPKGSDVVIQIHYHRDGRTEKDKTSVGLYFSKKKVDRPFQGGVMAGTFLFIPAGDEHFVVKGSTTVHEDMLLHSIMPHMHMLGKQIKVTMTPPAAEGEGAAKRKPILLFDIKEWDYNWQETYIFKEPLRVKAGTQLDLEAVYDNSAKNPSNPFSPPRVVTFGEQTFNEMCFVFLGGTSEKAGTTLPMTMGGRKKDKDAGKTFTIPSRLTDSGHILVRAKINGKGPFNFIVDTGAPLVYVSEPIAKKLGMQKEMKGLNTLDSFQVEGGPVHDKLKCLVETPYQLEGMNALGFAGVELHGIIGYSFLSHYKMEIDLTADHMTWTKLDFTPPAPQPIGAKGKEGDSLDATGKIMKTLAALLGSAAPSAPATRGFFGMELVEKDKGVVVLAVLPKGPAATAGLEKGDRIVAVKDKMITTPNQVMDALARVTAGQEVRVSIQRGDTKKDITITAGEGL